MKKRILSTLSCVLVMGVFLFPSEALAQCSLTGAVANNTTPITPPCGGTPGGTASVGSGTYTNFSVINQACYAFSTCGSGFDTQVTLYNTGTAVLDYNNNNGPECGGPEASVHWAATFTGTVRVLVNRWNCVGHDFTGQSASLKYYQIPPVIVSSSSVMCPGDTRQLVAENGCNQVITNGTWTSSPSAITGGNTFAPTVPGTYTITFTHGQCSVTQTINVSTPSTPPTSIAGNTSVCPGGSVNLNVVGGTLGTNGVWVWYEGGCGQGSPIGQGTGLTVTPTSTTTYFVRAQDDCGNTACAQITVTVNTLSTAASSATASPSNVCAGTPTTLSVSGGSLGTGAQWYWYSGACGTNLVGAGASITVNPQASTVYYVRAEGPCNTTNCASVNVSVTPAPNLSFGLIQGPSACGACDGSIQVVTTSGSTPYTYSWNHDLSLNSATATGLCAGPYFVTVTDANGCSDVSSVTLSDPGASVVTISSSDGDDIICAGESVTFTATGAFTYVWYLNGQPQPTAPNPWTIDTLDNNDVVNVIGTDYNFCSYTSTGITTTVNPNPIISATVTDPSGCGLSDGSITTTVTSGLPGYTYQWSGSPGGNQPDTTGLDAGVYGLTVTDSRGCTDSDVYGLNDPGAAPVTLTVSDPDSTICAGELVTFTASGSVSYTFFENADSVSIANPYTTDSLFMNNDTLIFTNGVVIVEGVDGNGCTAVSNPIPMTVLPGPTVTLTVTDSDTAICVGETMDFVGGGANTYEFFLNSTSQNTPNNTTLHVFSGLNDQDTVVVLGTDLNGCQVYSDEIVVTVFNPPTLSVVNLQHPQSCGASDGFITMDASGGTAPYSYIWNTVPQETTPAIDSLSAGPYYVQVTDTNGCTADTLLALSDIGSVPTTMVSDDSDTTICGNDCVTFTASGNATYQYFVNGILEPSGSVNPWTTCNLQDGDFVTVIGYDTAFCASTADAQQFTVHPAIHANIVAMTSPTACGVCDGVGYVAVVGGTPAYTYSWTGGDSNSPATTLCSGVVNVTVTDVFGCTANDAAGLSDINAPIVNLVSDAPNNTICEGDTVTFTASSTTTGLNWTFTTNLSSQSSTTNPFVSWTLVDNDQVVVVGTDTASCTGTDLISMVVKPAPQASLSGVPDYCHNVDSALLVGGLPSTGNYIIQYTNGEVSAPYIFPSSLTPGTHVVTFKVDGNNGCSGYAYDTIMIHQEPLPDLGNDTTACGLTLDGGSGVDYTYLWSNDSTTQTIWVETTGVYQVMVTDTVTGCVGEDAIGVTALPIPSPLFTVQNDTVGICTNDSLLVCVTDSNLYTPVIWDGVPSNCFVFDDIEQWHTVEVTNALGCSRKDSIYVIVYPEPNPYIEITQGDSAFCKGGEATITVLPGPWASVLWNAGNTTQDVVVHETYNYCVTVLDANGCIDSTLAAGCQLITVWGINPTIQEQAGVLTAAVTNDPQTNTYEWYNDVGDLVGTGQDYEPTVTGTYHVIVTDSNDCEETSSTHYIAVGIQSVDIDYHVNVYPNPTEGVFTLEADFGKMVDARIELRNVLGQLIIPREDISSEAVRRDYNLNHLSSGVYVLSIETPEGKVIRRITKR